MEQRGLIVEATRFRLIFFIISLMAGPCAAFQSRSGIAEQAEGILRQRCFKCHGGTNGQAPRNIYVLDRDRLVSSMVVIPGDRNSLLLKVVESGAMPLGEQRLAEAEKAVLRDWISTGAANWSKGEAKPANRFLSDEMMVRAIRADLTSADTRSQRFLRYFTFSHLYNAGASEAELSSYRDGLSKLLNSLSWHREITRLTPIEATKTVLRIDIRDLNWTDSTWRAIFKLEGPVHGYPFNIYIPSADMDEIEALGPAFATPIVRGDWFVAHASIPPLYHEILGLPDSLAALETMLGVDVARDIAEEKNVLRGGVRNSDVSRNNRVVERHSSSYGAYWRSFDFSSNTEEQNIFQNPLNFNAAGGEIIFNLPNGMQAYLLVNADGKRIDKGPPTIVSDRNHPDSPEVVNGRSCMSCHFAGMKNLSDEVRPVLEAVRNAQFDRAKALALYLPQNRLDDYLTKDRRRFEVAVNEAGGAISVDFRTEPINTLAQRYESQVSTALAASEVGLTKEEFVKQVQRNQGLLDLGVGQLVTRDGSLKRDLWEKIYRRVFMAVNLSRIPIAARGCFLYRQFEYEAAIPLLRQAAANGSYRAMACLSSAYFGGNGVSKDEKEAIRWLRRGAEAGCSWCMNRLSWHYHYGDAVEVDYEESMRWARKAADAGDTVGMQGVAVLYETGDGVRKSYSEALKWYVRAADKSNPVAMQKVGELYQTGGFGLVRDDVEAVKWYQRAAEAGDIVAMKSLGKAYELGSGVSRDLNAAISWYRQSRIAEDELKRLGVRP